jgi:NADH dehydrogenase
MRILITGISSSIGKVLIKHLPKDAIVTGVTRITSKVSDKRIKIIEHDFMSDEKLHFDNIDIIIHMAAETPGEDRDYSKEKLERFNKINVQSTIELVETAKQTNVKQFLFISSHAVNDLREKDGVIRDAYAKSKIDAEKIVQSSDLNYTIYRPSGIYGNTRYWQQYLQDIKQLKRVVIKGLGKRKIQFILVDDLAIAIVSSLNNQNAYNKLYDIGGKTILTWKEYYQELKSFTKSRYTIIDIPYSVVKLVLSILSIIKPRYKLILNNINLSKSDLVTDNTLAEKDLNYKPMSFIEGLKTIETK